MESRYAQERVGSSCRAWFASTAANRVRGIVGIVEHLELDLDHDRPGHRRASRAAPSACRRGSTVLDRAAVRPSVTCSPRPTARWSTPTTRTPRAARRPAPVPARRPGCRRPGKPQASPADHGRVRSARSRTRTASGRSPTTATALHLQGREAADRPRATASAACGTCQAVREQHRQRRLSVRRPGPVVSGPGRFLVSAPRSVIPGIGETLCVRAGGPQRGHRILVCS